MLRETLDSDLKDAMRNKEALRRTVLRTMLSEIRNAEINSQTTLDDEGIISVLTKQVQQRKDSAEAYNAANRQKRSILYRCIFLISSLQKKSKGLLKLLY